MTEKLKRLVMKRTAALNRLKETYEVGVKVETDPSKKVQFLVRADECDEMYGEFGKSHNSVIMLLADDAEFEEHDAVRKQADIYYYAIKMFKRDIYSTDAPASSQNASNIEPPRESAIQLKMDVPTFDGNFKFWSPFIDMFDSLVHNNVGLSDVRKFHYLHRALKGDAFNVIKGLSITENNYLIAYEALRKRYDNKRFTATCHYHEIFNAPAVQKPAARELRALLDTFSENISALKALKFNTDSWDFLLFNMMLPKLDSQTRTEFEKEFRTTELPTFQDLSDFLEEYCKALDSAQLMNSNPSGLRTKTPTSSSFIRKSTSAFITDTPEQSSAQKSKCIACSGNHILFRCQVFLAKTPRYRFALVKQHNYCINCLRAPHNLKQCPTSVHCKICKFPHHTLLHFPKNNEDDHLAQSTEPQLFTSTPSHSQALPNANANDSTCAAAFQPPNLTLVGSSAVSEQSTVLLSTIVAHVKDIYGFFQKVRIMLDTGSMANFISQNCADRLGLPRKKVLVPIEGLNNMSSSCNQGMIQCQLRPCDKLEPIFNFEAIIVPKICSSQPKMVIDCSRLAHIQHLPLADPQFNIPGDIDLLIGAELVPYLLERGRLVGNPDQPVALETVFGWILQGRAQCLAFSNHLTNLHVSTEPTLDISLQKFWELESISRSIPPSPDDIKCDQYYNETTYRETSGRFVVSLPFKHSAPTLGNSYNQALKRFNLLEKRLSKNPNLREAYVDFMTDYLKSGHMSLVSDSAQYRSPLGYYIPHFCISKDTKIRVVFDASCATSNGVSLNDTQLTGPKLQQDISSILLQFRFHRYVFICDIRQMYRQILINVAHRNFQKILWRFSDQEPLQEYVLNTVTYGVSSSPYLALRTIKELAIREGKKFPRAAQALEHQIFIDDIAAGADLLDALLSLQQELIQLLQTGKFELRKWASNHEAVLSAVNASHLQMPCSFDKDEPICIKVLGLQWNPSGDTFSYSCSPKDLPCTKRNILSQIFRVYDPLGFLSPVVLFAKLLMQKLWLSHSDWDEIPSDDVCRQWNNFKSELPELRAIKIPRRIFVDEPQLVELHGFCDASQTGYGAAVYLKCRDFTGTPQIHLVIGKSRVAPLKTAISIPRMELIAAALLSDLVDYVKQVYARHVTLDAVFAWSDSQVTLAWLASPAHRWKPFVANRVAHIHGLIPFTSWRYVPTAENPADCVSRGVTPAQLVNHGLWFQGPAWLAQEPNNWPQQPDITEIRPQEVFCEERTLVLHTSFEEHFLTLLVNKFSSLPKIQHTIAYVLRFISNTRSDKLAKQFGPLSPLEIQNALLVIVKHVQMFCFTDIVEQLNKNNLPPKPFRKLAVFLDGRGCLRVGGRIRRSNLSYDEKHPLLLPKSHRLTELIIEWAHKQNLHVGFKTLQYILLQQFWILSPRTAIHRVLSQCIRCFRAKPKSYSPFMADLPAVRVSQLKVFSVVCLDYAGPLSITMSKSRGAKSLKAYICVFVCCAVKAIHLELVSDLTSEAFIAAFRRFVARRGRCSQIISDQGTSFVGAHKQILEYFKLAAQTAAIQWSFNSPGAPHFNGLAEAGVKSVKTHLYRVLGDQLLTYEEMYTLLVQIEAVLNSRPLCAVSHDPNDLQPLTPSHFLTQEPLHSSIPDPDLSNMRINRLSRWQLIQRMHTDFWRRWQHEYLHTLQQRAKWCEKVDNIQVGRLVLIKNEQRPPLQWLLARVTKVHPGTDGFVRVVTLKTPTGLMQRPVVKLCPLPNH
ncbi:uncharacterized protein LOC132708258 [Cylas formicarius]|uniref:uncharacterized protein LOC132708258 n=1 Tax=Cylas formicarius TaxID=197179 RepID=UPI002958B762|nr:uncharacterized protein LOC132708258 [Cylas formicarius]